MRSIYHTIKTFKEKGIRGLAVLLDPDKIADEEAIRNCVSRIGHSEADLIFVGGSLIVEDSFHQSLKMLRSECTTPIVLFPGSLTQISTDADAILFLSLISGRNPELLIGQHVQAAPMLKKRSIEIISTGYMLIDCGRPTTASYISHTLPIPWNKPEIAAVTAMAGEMLGLSCIYLDGGSGAERPVSNEMIRAVRESVSVPLIVGGGIRTESDANAAWDAGADLIVVGTAFEEDPEIVFDLARTKNIR
ncbi:MAG: geranylgeranylglyceryl/heptaprenylglyceryl phosphate synthase [Crocinitomicaceae bacterium]|nr:geranylgeranylglyceryl/heptaprenylglyceryl phosphate synthase [Crocinitomicaceae bacterium]